MRSMQVVAQDVVEILTVELHDGDLYAAHRPFYLDLWAVAVFRCLPGSGTQAEAEWPQMKTAGQALRGAVGVAFGGAAWTRAAREPLELRGHMI